MTARDILTLDPRLPLVWRSPTSVQLGIDDPPVVLSNVAVAEERMLAALSIGATRSGLAMIGSGSGFTQQQVADFCERVKPALRAPAVATAPALVTIAGVGATVSRLGPRLTEAGVSSRLSGPIPDAAIDDPDAGGPPTTIAVVVGHYVLDPQFYGLWLRRDIPHLPIVYSDTSVAIGPLVEPGRGPCLYCLDRWRTDADPAWPAIASQLWGRRSTAETEFVASEVAAIATRIVLSRLASGPRESCEAVRLNVSTGETTALVPRRHPDCHCWGIDGMQQITASEAPADATPSGTETERSSRRAARQTSTKTGEAAAEPA